MTEEAAGEALSPLEEFLKHTHDEFDHVSNGLKEIAMLVSQSQGEVDKLAQRNAQITTQLHQLQNQFETVPREDIRTAYEDALDTQQRLFTMSGQLEKLESDESNLSRYRDYLSRALSILDTGSTDLNIQVQDGSGETIIEQIIGAQEDERKKISRQIHDGPAQALSNFILQTEIALRLFDVDTEKAKEELQDLKATATTTFASVRDFIFDLRPMMLDDLGLIPTIRRYTEAFQEKTGLEITLVVTGSERRFEVHREVLCFRTIQELLGNVRDHAKATQVKLSLTIGDAEIRVSIEDNGIGFAPHVPTDDNRKPDGLAALEERVNQIGGEFNVASELNEGTTITLSIPV